MRSFYFLSTTLLFNIPLWAQQTPPNTAAPPASPSARESRVELPSATQSVDEELLSLARQANINVLIDATQLPTQTFASPQRTSSLYGALNALAKERQTTWLQHGEKTFLFWREPDFKALAREVANTILKPETAPPNPTGATLAAPVSLDEQLSLYFLRQNTAPETAKDVAVATLPPALREAVVAAGRTAVLGPQGLAGSAAWFSDEFWKTARLRVQNLDATTFDANQKPVKTSSEWLFLGGQFQSEAGRKGTIWRSLGAVPTQAALPAKP